MMGNIIRVGWSRGSISFMSYRAQSGQKKIIVSINVLVGVA